MLEVMISLLLFTVGILAMAALTDTSMKSIALAQGSFRDSNTAVRFIECILARPYTEGLAYDPLATDCATSGMENGSTIKWEVQDNFPSAGTQQIRVTVLRPNRNGMRKLTYEYVRAKDFR